MGLVLSTPATRTTPSLATSYAPAVRMALGPTRLRSVCSIGVQILLLSTVELSRLRVIVLGTPPFIHVNQDSYCLDKECCLVSWEVSGRVKLHPANSSIVGRPLTLTTDDTT
jgi:hypothetical protein